MRTRRPWHERYFHFILLLPALAIIVFLTVYPLINVFRLSLFEYNYLRGTAKFVGLNNYTRLFSDRFFVDGIRNTFVFSFSATVLEVLLGLALAVLFNREFWGRKILLPLVIFPMMLSTMVVCAIWRAMYHYDYGIINHIVNSFTPIVNWFRGLFGLPPMAEIRIGWLFNPRLALWSVVIVDIWQYTPMAFLILLAGLQSIPKDLYEAARVDGASGIGIFRYLTLPLLRKHLFLALLLRSIDTFKIFDKVYALTGGGPGSATETISFYIYREGFKYFNMGRASAAAVVMFVTVAMATIFYIRQVLRRENV
ncbi:MAG: sugar ABC transporter permease [Clostridia bacterium]|nr:sugar ABC transporter permease [Clostridia bacterium]